MEAAAPCASTTGARYRGRSKTPSAVRAAVKAGTSDVEPETVFREAFEAQRSRCELLTQSLEELDPSQDQGVTGGMSQVNAFSPDVPDGKASWKEAFEAAKDFADLLEKDVEKAPRVSSVV
eukprot:symbB.v1.2.026722.t1/scaffold2695.1/size72873/2